MEEAIKQINALISSETNTDARIAFRTALLIFTEAKLKYNEEMLALEKKSCVYLSNGKTDARCEFCNKEKHEH